MVYLRWNEESLRIFLMDYKERTEFMAVNFVLECDKKLDYLSELEARLQKEASRILSFFHLTDLKEPKKIKIWTDRALYQKYLEPYVGTYYEWMNGDTYDGNINLLSIEECQKTQAHQDMDFEELVETIQHEFVHACQQEINDDAEGVEWFWEALATNLGNPFDHVASLQCEAEDLIYRFTETPYNYVIAYTLGKYLLENYPHEKILDYVKHPEHLKEDTRKIFEEEKVWFRKNYLPLSPVPKAKNEDFVFYTSECFREFSEGALPILSKKKKDALAFFGLSQFRKTEINLFDNQEQFRSFIQQLRWKESKIPDYCQGTYDDMMVNCFIDPDKILESYQFGSARIFHEYLHILYSFITDQRVVWFDEGLALNLSGEMNFLQEEEAFKNWLMKEISWKEIPNNMNHFTHENSSFSNGYAYSYLAVRYLLETQPKEAMQEMVKNSQEVIKFGKTVLPAALDYYNNQLHFKSENSITVKQRK